MSDRTLILLGAAHAHTPDHVQSAHSAGWRIAAVHDRDGGRARAVAQETGAEVVEDLTGLSRYATAAFVCSETVHHPEDVEAALRAGLPVFCEKPLAAHGAGAQALARLSAETGHFLETGYFLRSYPALQEVRKIVQSGRIGGPVHVRANFSHNGAYAEWLDITGWMSDPELAVYGGFADEAVHVLDWLLWTFGDVQAGAVALGHSLGLPVDDHGAALLHLGDGGTAVLEAGWTDTRMRLEIDITCTNGGASVTDGAVRVWERDGQSIMDRTMEPLDAGRGSAAFLARCSDPDLPALVSPEEAARVTALLEELYARRR